MQVEAGSSVYSPEGLVEGDVIKVKGALRCAYCHGAAQGLLECCDGCGVLVHADCRRELGRCSTLGCGAPSAQKIALSARSPQAGILITGASLRRWARRYLVPLVMALVCFGGCFFVSSAIRVPHYSPHRRQMTDAMRIRVASANFKADHGRYPTSLEELLQAGPGGPYLDSWRDHELERYRFVTHGRVVWVAVEIDSEDNRYETETIRLLEVLYEHDPGVSWAQLSSSARSQRPL